MIYQINVKNEPYFSNVKTLCFLFLFMSYKVISRPSILEGLKIMVFYTEIGIIMLFDSFNTLSEHMNFISTTNAAFNLKKKNLSKIYKISYHHFDFFRN